MRIRNIVATLLNVDKATFGGKSTPLIEINSMVTYFVFRAIGAFTPLRR